MFLRRVTITGFKSFANKTVIDLEHGITGVVGPNGSGKSNIADAVRWALGEQGKSRLRLGERDEVVFAGNDKRARASFAEVVLLFDNEDGAFALDLTEVEIARRMYRSGETDYRLAGRSVRLSDIQALLAHAGVGASSYAVIGQGMIDSMLMSSPAERKLLFDEAAGIRGPELGREAALRKLTATATNLTRLRDIAAELAPRLGALETAVGAADERAALQARVAELRTAVVATGHSHWAREAFEAAGRLKSLTAAGHQLRHQLQSLEQARRHGAQVRERSESRRVALSGRLAELERDRDEAASQLAGTQSAIAAITRDAHTATDIAERLSATSATLAASVDRLSELSNELTSSGISAARAAKAVERSGREVTAAQAALVDLRDGNGDGARDQYLDHALQILKTLAVGLGTPEYDDHQVRLLVHKAGRLLSHASRSGSAELLAELKTAQKHLEAAMARRDVAVEHQTNVSITIRSLEIDLTHQEIEVKRYTERQSELQAELSTFEQSASRLDEQAAAEKAAAASLAAATYALEHGRSELATLGIGHSELNAQTELITKLTEAKSAVSANHEAHSQAHRDHLAAKSELAAIIHQAADWDITISAPTLRESLPVLADQLARAETLLEAKTEQYEQQLDEYQEVTSRQSELTAQVADLEIAEADLRTLVAELDILIRARFKENFEALASQFSLYFARLFDGGTASLELTENDESGYGITIKASPKGKRLATIAALSGGERALAGVALVAAIMRVNPSPFVVLDEIDAALDEANSGRLAGILTELQQYSQLIVITHNRQTMKAARVLFGVTMGEHHTSHLISMRLEQATQLAAR